MIKIANRQIFIFFFDFLNRRIWATLYLYIDKIKGTNVFLNSLKDFVDNVPTSFTIQRPDKQTRITESIMWRYGLRTILLQSLAVSCNISNRTIIYLTSAINNYWIIWKVISKLLTIKCSLLCYLYVLLV